jgi:Domain of unknown function (DUF4307)
MNNAILADPSDKKRTRGRQVSETRATTPAFPPGRYGRRRDGKRHLGAPIAFGVIVLVVCVALAVKLYHQYGDPTYDPQIIGWSDITDSQITINFTVNVPAGGTAACVLRARNYDGAEVGRRTVTVSAKGDNITIEAKEPVPTTARASVGDVLSCQPPG